MSELILIEVPGSYREEIAYLDLETVKVPCDWTSPAGEKLGRRWSVFMAGVAMNGVIEIIERTGTEEECLAGIDRAIGLADTVLYRATRKFDEMILKGRYTYARRGPAPAPFYPALPDAEGLIWDCRRPEPDGEWEALRDRELMSRGLWDQWTGGAPGARELVLIHNLRDIVELIGAYGEPDAECEAWCRRVLTDREFARRAIFDDEERGI